MASSRPPSSPPSKPASTTDYSKWDMLDDDSDDERLASQFVTEVAKHNHGASLGVIKEWIEESSPFLEPEAASCLLDFVRVQHRGIHETNVTVRHQEVTAFLEKAQAEGRPSMLHTLLDLCSHCHAQIAKEERKAQAERMLPVVMSALNTLWATEWEGGARALYEKMLREPDGRVATKFKAYGYATDCVASPPPRLQASLDSPPEEPTLADLPLGSRDWWGAMGSILLAQLAIAAVVLAGVWVWWKVQGWMGEGAPPEPAESPLPSEAEREL